MPPSECRSWPSKRTPPGRQHGVALISVLLVVAVVVAVGAALLREQEQQRRRTAAVLHGGQVLRYLAALEDWSLVVLERDRDEGARDALDEDWALGLAPMAINGGFVSGALHDAQGRFNLNNLVVEGVFSESERDRFVRLLELLETPPVQAESIADALRDWMDEDQTESGSDGGEDYYYLGLPTPYRTAGRALVAASELLLVRGMNAELWEALAPHVAALPGYRPVNVNTATEKVLLSLSSHIDDASVQDILDQRLESPFESAREFLEFVGDVSETQAIPPTSIAVGSEYFLLEGRVSIGDAQLAETALIHRTAESAAVLRRALGEQL